MLKQIVVKDLLISYSQTGQENGQAVLFLHGWRSQAAVWQGIVQKLGNWEIGKLTLYALDLPGFGNSQTPKMAMTVWDYEEVVAEFIKKLGLQKVIIVGHSFGGRVGIKLASTHPDLISKLVLADSAGFTMNAKKKSLMEIAATIARPFFKPKFMQGLRQRIYRSIGAEDYVATPELQKTFVNIVSEDLTADMQKIKAPTLIINGENDLDTPVEFGKRMNSLIPNSRFLILPGSGHFSFLEQPEEFVKKLTEFIG